MLKAIKDMIMSIYPTAPTPAPAAPVKANKAEAEARINDQVKAIRRHLVSDAAVERLQGLVDETLQFTKIKNKEKS